jgi:virulence-associated protein VapD
MPSSRKEISFDLDTKKLEKYFDNISNAYYEIRRELRKVGFEHRQGSVYNSIKPMNKTQISEVLYYMCEQLPWLPYCARSIDVTSIGKTHSLMDKVNELCKDFNEYPNKNSEYNITQIRRKSR